MEFKDLVGKHILTGVEMDIKKATEAYYDDARTMAFVLDGVTYLATEDPGDGYRSSCDELEIIETKIKNTFPPQGVIGRMMDNTANMNNDVIQFFNASTNELILEIGTDNYDDYYPSCVMSFYPEAMSINDGR